MNGWSFWDSLRFAGRDDIRVDKEVTYSAGLYFFSLRKGSCGVLCGVGGSLKKLWGVDMWDVVGNCGELCGAVGSCGEL